MASCRRVFTQGLDVSIQRGECPLDLWPVGVVLPFGSRFKGKPLIVGVALVLLFAVEATFVAVVATGHSNLLSPSIPSRRNSASPHEAIFMSPSIN